MTCKHCCGANQLFDLKNARKKARSYDKKGPTGATKKLIEGLKSAIKKHSDKTDTLLDIGGGIGAIGLELQKTGVHSVMLVDASDGFLNIARKEYQKRSIPNDVLTTHFGDFLDVKEQMSTYDIVTLDKVICCYPDAWELIKQSASKSTNYYALVFPWGGPFGRFFARLGNLALRIFYNNGFHTYVHDVPKVFQTVKDQGFELVSHQRILPWHIVLWKRVNN